jgi:hypothetical protein
LHYQILYVCLGVQQEKRRKERLVNFFTCYFVL